jgi:hypothetical protein
MQIRNILAGHSDPAPLGKRGEPVPAGGGPAPTSEAVPTSARSINSAAAAVLAKYDVSDITPLEFTEMLQELHQTGALTREEYQELAAARVELESSGVGPDDPVDLLEFHRHLIDKLERRLEDAEKPQLVRQELRAARRRLDWIEKFAVVQDNPAAAGINALA